MINELFERRKVFMVLELYIEISNKFSKDSKMMFEFSYSFIYILFLDKIG